MGGAGLLGGVLVVRVVAILIALLLLDSSFWTPTALIKITCLLVQGRVLILVRLALLEMHAVVTTILFLLTLTLHRPQTQSLLVHDASKLLLLQLSLGEDGSGVERALVGHEAERGAARLMEFVVNRRSHELHSGLIDTETTAVHCFTPSSDFFCSLFHGVFLIR